MDLPNFIHVLDGEQQMSWFTQELYDRQAPSVGLKTLRPKQLKMLSKVKRDYSQESNEEHNWVSKIYGVYNYDILSNPEYATAIGYEHPADRINFGGKYDFLDEHDYHNQRYYFKKIWMGQDMIRKCLWSNFTLKTQAYQEEMKFMMKSDYVGNTIKARLSRRDFEEFILNNETAVATKEDQEIPDHFNDFLQDNQAFDKVYTDMRCKEKTKALQA